MAGKYDKNIKITVDDNGSLKQKTEDINKLNKAVDNNTKKSGNLDRNMKGNAKMSSNASKNFSKQAQGMQGVLVPAYAEVAARVFALTAAYTALERAADFRVLLEGQTQYARLTGKNMGTVAKKIQEASGHMLDFRDASKAAALGVTSGLQVKTMVRMAEVARAASVALGRGMVDSMDRLTRGIVKAEPEILDEIGIIIRLDTVYKEYAETLDTTTAALTETEKMQARVNAILGQGETKFGDIAKAIDSNGWSVLAASVMDVVNSFAAFVSGPIEGLAKILADSKFLLIALLALITRSLAGKLSGVFKGFNKQIGKIPKGLKKATEGLNKFKDKLNIKRAGYAEKLVPTGQAEQDLKKTLSGDKVNLKGVFGTAMSEGITGDKFAKAASKSLGLILAGATAKLKDGVITGGALKGGDEKLIKTLDQQNKALQQSAKQARQGMKGLMGLQFLDWITNAMAGITSLTSKMTLSGLGFLNYAKQVGSVTQKVGLFSRDIADSEGVITSHRGSLKLITDTMKADFEKIWGKGALGKLLDNMKSFTSKTLSRIFGMGKSMSSIVDTIAIQFNKLTGFFTKQGDMFKNKMPGWVSSGYKSIKNFTSKILGTLSLTAKGITGFLAGAITGLVNGLQILSFAIGAISMLGYVGRMFTDWGKFMGEATEAATELADSLDEIDKRLRGAINVNMDGVAASLTGALTSADFISSVTSDMAESLAKAIAAIDMEAVISDGLGNTVDWFKDLFGVGLEDKLGNALGSALNAQAQLGKHLSETMSKALEEGLGNAARFNLTKEMDKLILQKLRKGISLTAVELKALNDGLENLGAQTLVDNIGILSRKIEAQGEAAKLASGNVRDLSSSFDGVDKSLKGILKGAIADTPFTKLAEDYTKLKVLMNKSDISESNKVLGLFEKGRFSQVGVSEAQTEDYTSRIDQLKKFKKDMSALKLGEGSESDVKKLEKTIKNSEAALAKLAISIRTNVMKLHKLDSFEGIMPLLFGGDLNDFNDKATRLNTTIAALKQNVEKLTKINPGVFIEEIASSKAQVLSQKLGELIILSQLDKKTKTLKPAELEDLNSQISLLTEKQAAALRVNEKMSTQRHKEASTIYLVSKRLQDQARDLNYTAIQAQKVKDSRMAEEYTKILKSMDPLSKESDSLAHATNIITSNFEGQGAVVDDLISKWQRLNTEYGRFNIKLQASVLASKAAISVSGAALSSARLGAINASNTSNPLSDRAVEVEKHLTDLRAKQAVDLDKMKTDMRAQEKASAYIAKFVIAQEEANSKMLANAKISFLLTRKTTKLNSIKDRIKAIQAERSKLEYERVNLEMLPDLLDQRERIVELERQYAQEGVDFQLEQLQTMEKQLTLSKLINAHQIEAKEKEFRDFAPYRDAIAAFSSGVTPSISQAVSDYIQGIENDVSPLEVAQKAGADAIGGWAGSMINEQLTGRGGMVAGLFEKFGSKDLADNLFGKDPDEVFNLLTQAIKDLTYSININNNRLKSSLEAMGWKFTKNVDEETLNAAARSQSITDANKETNITATATATATATMLKDLKAKGFLISPSATQKTIEQAWKLAFPDKAKADAAATALTTPGSAYVHDIHAEKLLNRIADALINPGGKTGTNLAYSEGGFFSDAEGTPMEIMERVSKQRYKKEGKTTLPYTGMFGGHPKSQYYDFQLEKENRKGKPQPDQLPQNYVDHFINKGYLPEGSKSGQPVKHDLDNIYEKFNISKKDPLAGKVYLQVASAGDMPDWQKKIWDKAIKDGAEQAKKVLNDVKIQKSQGTKGLQNYPYSDHRSTRDANSPREMFKKQGGPLNGTQRGLPYIQHPESYRKFNMAYKEPAVPASNPGIQAFIRVITEWLPEIKKIGVTLIGLTPSKLADGTLQGNNMLGPGEIGPKTEHQTILENLLTDLVTNTPPIEQQSLALDAAIRSSNGRDGANKVEVVNTDEIKSDALDLSIADSAKGVAEQGVRQLITSGEVNTRNLAGSFATSLLSKATDKAVDAVMDFDWMSLLFANGGIAKGGFRAFAKGGVVNRPTLGLVGEGKYNEAVVPLPDGKSIPVIGGNGGGTENNITVNVTIDSDGNAKSDTNSGMNGDTAKQLGYMVSQAVQLELVEQKRPGGLLSSY